MSDLTVHPAEPKLAPMTHDEARRCADAIIRHVSELRPLVREFRHRRGWESLGYRTWRAWALAELPRSQAELYRQDKAGEIEERISPMGEIGTIPERHLRPLTQLPPAQQAEAWQRAVETAPDGKVTTRHVEAVVREIKGPAPEPEADPKEAALHEAVTAAMDEITANAEIVRANVQYNWAAAKSAVSKKLLILDADDIGAALLPEDADDDAAFVRQLRAWLDRFEPHLHVNHPLRLIGGDRA